MFQMTKGFDQILDDLKDKKILVIGDLMLDKFIWGSISKISAESSVPVVRVENETYNPGGIGNTANNIVSLGGDVLIVGVIGEDNIGDILLDELKKRNISDEGIFRDNSRPTIQKIRVMSQSQHLLRVDYEKEHYIKKELEGKIINILIKKVPEIDSIIVSDYIKGTITENIANKIIELAHKYNKPILIDTKPKHVRFYKNVTLVKPNLKEAIEMTGEHDLIEIGNKLKEQFNSNILITKGKDGMSLFFKDGGHIDIPTKAREVFDVSGAGDTVIATLGLALGANASLEDSVNLANIAAGLVVEKRGIVAVTREEMKNHLKIHIVPKEWGEEHWLVNDIYCGKRLILKKGYRCSLHYHKKKDETFYVAKGKVLLELHGKKIIMNPGDSQRIKPNDIHRFSGLENSEIIEFSTHHDEEDTYRKEPSGKIPEF